MKFDLQWLLTGLSDEQVRGVITVGWRGLLVIHILWACGWASYLGLGSGFALASDLAVFKSEAQKRRLKELNTELLDAKAKQCSATGEAWRLYFRAYNDLRAEFYEVTGREAPDPPCDNFKLN